VHQFLVVLTGTDPLVWRRIQVPDAMGWLDYRLHEFRLLRFYEALDGGSSGGYRPP
jgi:hypothetical protein